MPATARKLVQKPRLRAYYATVLVTRVEEWWVEAESEEEARALLTSGQGHHAGFGDRVHVEVERLLEGAEE